MKKISKMATKKRTSYYAFLWAQQDGKCFLCGNDMLPSNANWDHFLPKSFLPKAPAIKKHDIRHFNKVLTHVKCNSRKGNRLPTKEEIARFISITGKSWPYTHPLLSRIIAGETITDEMIEAHLVTIMENQ